MTPHDHFDLFRREMSDETEDYLWSDEDVWGYIDDSQKMFCRLTDGIADASTPRITQLAVGVGADWLKLDPSILKIRSAYLVSTGAPISIVNQEDMEGQNIRFDGRTGPIRRLITGMEENKARCYPVASVADTIQLSVFRLPKAPIEGKAGECFEIAEQHHRHLLLWSKHLAYLKQDAETIDRTKAAEFEGKFLDYCAKAKREQQAKRHKIRVVAYGGI